MTRSPLFARIALLAALAAPLTDAAVVERIAVRVNDRILTSSELQAREEDAMRELLRSEAGLRGEPLQARAKEIRKKLVDDAVKELLLLDKAEALGIEITEAEVGEALMATRRQNRLTNDDEFRAALAQAGLTEEKLRETYRTNLTIQRVIGREIQSKLDFSDEQLRAFYNSDKEHRYRLPDRARLSEILVLASDDKEQRALARKVIDEARARIVGGEDFAAVAKEVSQGGTAEKGGELGVVVRGELAPEIDAVVFSLESGQLSEPVSSKFGWHLLRVDERFPVTYTSFEEVKEQIRDKNQDSEFEKRIVEYVDKLRASAFIRIDVDEIR